MTYKILASGSSGNALLIILDETKILVDCGLSFKKIQEKLKGYDLSIEDIDALLITHSHQDHTRSLSLMSKTLPVYMSELLFDEIKEKFGLIREQINFFQHRDSFLIKNILVTPVPVKHNCVDPVGFLLENNIEKIGVFTDVGYIDDVLIQALQRCSFVFIESNYDLGLLAKAERPWFLKNRILKDKGHLSNRDAAQLIAKVFNPQLKEVVLVHLSQDCNDPDVALSSVLEELQKHKINFTNIKAALSDGEIQVCRLQVTGNR